MRVLRQQAETGVDAVGGTPSATIVIDARDTGVNTVNGAGVHEAVPDDARYRTVERLNCPGVSVMVFISAFPRVAATIGTQTLLNSAFHREIISGIGMAHDARRRIVPGNTRRIRAAASSVLSQTITIQPACCETSFTPPP